MGTLLNSYTTFTSLLTIIKTLITIIVFQSSHYNNGKIVFYSDQ